MSLNQGQFAPSESEGPKMFKPIPLPGTEGPKPMGKELPLKPPMSKVEVWDKVRKRKLADMQASETLRIKNSNRANPTGYRKKRAELDEQLTRSSELAKQTKYSFLPTTGRSISRGFGPNPFNPNNPGHQIVSHLDGVNEDLRAKTGLEQPREVGLRQAAREKVAAESTPEAPKQKRPFTKAEMMEGARSLARGHWERTAPKPDLSEYNKAFKAHQAKHELWARQNPEPEYGTSDWKSWSKSKADFRAANPAPDTKPVEDARSFSNALFKDSEAYTAPRNYLKKALGVKNAAAVDVHVENHLRELNKISADTDTSIKAARRQRPGLDLSSKKEISPERSAAVEAFAKNPLSYHFGTGSGEGKKNV